MMSASNSSLRKIERGGGVLISEVVKYTNVTFETDESVLFIEVSSIQRCPDREIGSFHCSVCDVTAIPYSFGWFLDGFSGADGSRYGHLLDTAVEWRYLKVVFLDYTLEAIDSILDRAIRSADPVYKSMEGFCSLLPMKPKSNSPFLEEWDNMILQHVQFGCDSCLREFGSVVLHKSVDGCAWVRVKGEI